jgi:hypothetical protein
VADSCEHGNDPSGSIKGREFLDQTSDYQLLNKDSAPRSELVTKLEAFTQQGALTCFV